MYFPGTMASRSNWRTRTAPAASSEDTSRYTDESWVVSVPLRSRVLTVVTAVQRCGRGSEARAQPFMSYVSVCEANRSFVSCSRRACSRVITAASRVSSAS